MAFGQYSQNYAGRSNPLRNRAVTAKKQVFKTSEIAHLWAHQTQDAARNAQGNFYFVGKTIYSYGSHFPIAEHVENERGEKAILITTATYSVTTGGHVGDVKRSIPSSVQVFNVQDFDTTASQIDTYNTEIREAQAKAARAKSDWRRDSQLARVMRLHAEAVAFATFFDLDATAIVAPTVDVDALKAAVKADAIRKAAETKAAKAKLLKDSAEAIALWRAGRESEIPYEMRHAAMQAATVLDTMLRVKGDVVETSRGASFPVSHAKRGLALVRSVVARGEEWQRNGHTCHLGHYAIDRITASGTVYAGCHVVKFAEIERIAPQLEA